MDKPKVKIHGQGRPRNDIVTVETVGFHNFITDAAANRAVKAEITKTDFIRWLIDERRRLINEEISRRMKEPPYAQGYPNF